MTRKLHFSPDLALPLDAVTQTFAFLAKRNAGKTYAAGKLAEELLDAGAQVVIFDPIGNWYGLRTAADGKSPGFAIPVFGGERGDVPLEPAAGALIADVVVGRRTSAILDVSNFRKSQRIEFMLAFAEQFFHRKKTNRSPVHLIIEEAQKFAPQQAEDGHTKRMLGAMEDIVRLGRNYGIGASLISQRPQSVHKEVLNQAEVLVVLQTSGTHERKAIQAWIDEKDAEGEDALAELKSLQIGQAYVWSPSWLRFFGLIQVGKKRTYDASATPKIGERVRPVRPLAPVDLAEISQAMTDLITRAKDNDPKALRAEMSKLRGEMGKLRIERDRFASWLAIEKDKLAGRPSIKAPSIKPAELKRLEKLAEKLDSLRYQQAQTQQALATELAQFRVLVSHVTTAATAKPIPPGNYTYEIKEVKQKPGAVEVTMSNVKPQNGEAKLDRGARAMLTALAQFRPAPLTRGQMGTYAGISPKSGTFRNYLGVLRRSGFIVEANIGGKYLITSEGANYLGGPPPPARTTEELIALWENKFDAGARRMLHAIVERYPQPISRQELGQLASIESSSGTFRNYLGALRRAGLIVTPGHEVVASETLFP